MQIQTLQIQRRGRTFIFIEATPKSPASRSLLQRFKKEVKTLEKKWKPLEKKWKAGASAGKKQR